MPFEVPASKKSIDQNQFEFSLDGATYSIPLLKYAPVAAAEAFEQNQSVKAVVIAIDNPKAADAIRRLDGEQFSALLEAWQEASGVTTGESQGSTGS